MAGCGSYAKIEGFAFLPVTCFTMALTTFVSQNLGAKQYDRAKKGARFGILCSIIIAELIGACDLYSSADPDRGIQQRSRSRSLWCDAGENDCTVSTSCWRFLIVSRPYSAVPETHRFPMLVMLCVWCLFRVSYITVTVRLIPDIRVIFWAYPLTWSISSAIFLYLFLRGKWVYGFEKGGKR